MADNLTTTTTVSTIPDATKISTDEDATNGHVQRMKLAVSADGSSTHIGADANGIQVQGAAADAAAVTGKPVLIGGDDGTNAVNIAVDSDGAVHISDGSNSITIDGTVTANLSATDNAVLDTIDAVLDAINAKLVTGTVIGDVNLGATDNAVLDAIAASVAGTLTVAAHAVTNAGTFATQVDGAALTALQLIDDIVHVDDTATHATGSTKGAGIMAAATPTDGSVAANDIGMLAMSTDRRLHVDAQIVGTDAALDVSGATVTVDGSGVTQPVSGTVTSNLSATDNAVLDDIALRLTNSIDANNSTTTPLGGDATYTGTGTDVSSYAAIAITLDSSHDSATDGMTFQFSIDDTNWDDVYPFTYTAADGARRFQFPVTAQYFRIVYTNGSTLQTTIRIQTILHRENILTSIHRLVSNTDPDRSAQIVKAALIAQAAGSGDFVPVQTSAAGNLKVSTQEISDGLDIGAGNAGSETQRVSISTDDVNLSGILADTANMDTNLGTVAGAVAAGQVQVDIVADGAGLALAANQLADGHNVTIDNGAAGAAVNIQDGGNTITVDGTVTASNTAGDIAHDGADSGNPVKVGGKAYAMDGTAPGTDVAEADRTDFKADLQGRQLVTDIHPFFWHVSADYGSAQTNATVKAAPGASLRLHITDIVISNGAVAGNMTLLDGSGGSVLIELYPAINGGMSTNLRTPIALTANTLLAFTSTDATTHSVFVSGYTAP